ncbi:MAG: MFS transporter, partial [Desulfobulbaceae bacterium]|nr:MFS transporter [Desulfobulbaceae bacterium]
LHTTEWVVLVYLLTITATLLLWGHLGDRIGKNKIYSGGLLLFALGSLACAMAGSLAALVASRCGQAVGAAMMMSTGPAIIKQTFPANQLGRSLGLIGIAVSLGLMAGPALGGIIMEFFPWRAIFLVTVPVGFVFFLLARAIIPVSPRPVTAHRFDWGGALLWGVALLFFSLAISQATAADRSGLRVILLLAAGLLASLLFIKVETVSRRPLLPLQLFSLRFFNAAVLSAVLSFMILFVVIMLTPFYLDRVLALSSSRIGLVMMAIPVAVMVVAPVAGHLSDRIGARLLSTVGLGLSCLGLLLLAELPADAQPWQVAVRLSLMGCGQAMFLSPNSASLLGRVERQYAGASAALLATARNLGMLLGIAQAGLVFSLVFSNATGGLDMKDFSGTHTEAFLLAMHTAFHVAAAFGLLGVVISWQRGASGVLVADEIAGS